MKAAIYPGGGKAPVIEDLPDPKPGAGEVLLKVHRCGICGTDLSMTKGEMFDFGENVQFGHEYAGEIVELGAGVEGLTKGQNVAVNPSVACGVCRTCVAHGNNVLCQDMQGGAMLGFAEYAAVPASVITPLPSVLSLADGALIEPLAVSLYGLELAAIKPGETVVVLGGGTVALYAIYWARRLGAGKIVAMSRSQRRAELCLAMGADKFIAFGDTEIPEVIEALGGPADHVLECVGAVGMLQKGVMHVKPFGKVMSLGFCTAPDPVIPGLAAYKGATIQFAVGYGMRHFHYIADQMDKGHVDPKAIVTNEIPLAALPEMMATLRGSNNETKVHVTMV
ncbi:MAG: alcohol dehydrogenase catalytic domain-containing protein [Sphingomonadaceae bacterium]